MRKCVSTLVRSHSFGENKVRVVLAMEPPHAACLCWFAMFLVEENNIKGAGMASADAATSPRGSPATAPGSCWNTGQVQHYFATHTNPDRSSNVNV